MLPLKQLKYFITKGGVYKNNLYCRMSTRWGLQQGHNHACAKSITDCFYLSHLQAAGKVALLEIPPPWHTLFFKRNAAWKVAFIFGKSVDR